MLKQFRDIWVSIACLLLVAIMLLVLFRPDAVGEWLAQVEQAQQQGMSNYWCQYTDCALEFNELGEIIND
tara:strand:- start:521 stop:730 length:210 start_codon:yes stop_codon:yes gene_type:complete